MACAWIRMLGYSVPSLAISYGTQVSNYLCELPSGFRIVEPPDRCSPNLMSVSSKPPPPLGALPSRKAASECHSGWQRANIDYHGLIQTMGPWYGPPSCDHHQQGPQNSARLRTGPTTTAMFWQSGDPSSDRNVGTAEQQRLNPGR